MVKRKAVFLDADYTYRDGRTYARLLVKGKRVCRLLYPYDPYFYTDAMEKKDEIAKLAVRKGVDVASVKKVEVVEKIVAGEAKKMLKIYCNKPSDVVVLRDVIPFRCYEHGIHYARRFMMDFNIAPFAIIEYEREGHEIKKFLKISEDEKLESKIHLSKMAFDIETYNPLGAPREKKDPAIMISYASDEGKKGVITYKKAKPGFVHVMENEKGMIDSFVKTLAEIDPDILYGYNSANFDLPYLQARASALKTQFNIGRDGKGFKPIKKGMINGAKIGGRIHIDLYPAVRFFGFIGLIKAQEFTLEKIYSEVTGKKKKMVKRLEIWDVWDKNELDELAEYSLGDSEVTLELGDNVLPLLVELSKLTRMPLFDASLATSGQFVESFLMQESLLRNEMIPSKPSESEAMERQKNPIEGAFVKLPAPGIYENIAVFDFRGLYPSIIISYNIDPTRLVKNAESEVNESPTGAKFLKKPKGLIPATLERILDLRGGIKNSLKKLDKKSEEYKKTYARSHALKILANSFYGYLGYARSRWYNRQCAESVTAWGRHFIQETIEKAGKNDFEVLYGDSLPPERKIVVKDRNGQISIVPIGQFVEEMWNAANAPGFHTLAFDGKRVVFAPIKRAIKHNYPKEKGGLLEIATSHGKSVVTPQHSVYKYERGIKLADASELKVGDSLVSLTNAPSSEVYQEGYVFDAAKLDLGMIRDELYLYSDDLQFPAKKGVCPYCGKEAWLAGHVFARHKERRVRLADENGSVFSFIGVKNAKGGKIPRYWKMTRELAWLWGYYAAEGSVSEKSAVHSKEMISFGSQDRKVIEKVKRILEGITRENLAIIEDFDRRINKNMYYYRMQCSAAGALFAYGFGLGKTSSGKRVPEFILGAEESLKRAFLEGYLEGDGNHWHDTRYVTHFSSMSTKSLQLAEGLQYLFKTLTTREKNGFGKRIEHVYWSYRKDKPGIVNLRFQAVKGEEYGNFCSARIKTIRKIAYDGPVYDLEVEGTHNFVDAEGLILVHNTDSIFLLMGKKTKEDALAFLKEVNDELPEKMELELENFYSRGVFVSKKQGEAGAKKKYAMLAEDGSIKIRGFELVRRDWSRIAKDTQYRVLEAILKEGSKEKAVAIVKETLERLKKGDVPMADLTIYTQLTKKPEDYDIMSPELMAAKKAIARGAPLEKGSMVAYVITKRGGSISEKAEIADSAKDYDPDYYINNQVLPAVMKILKELGYDEDELKNKGKQKSMSSFFE
ncbi:MAG: DNA polymerase domain-containing protein [Candidatus ainarchaeum sp.]|nr:DNA polymerase domain-containing protein [Candidatus ainarchaeum sp.]